MATLSVPLNAKLTEVVDNLVLSGAGSNKADVVRRAIEFFAEDKAVQAVLRAERELDEGKGLSGDLDDLAAKL